MGHLLLDGNSLLDRPPLLGGLVPAGDLEALTPPQEFGPFSVLPQALDLATREDGTPDFRFTFIRRDDHTKPPYAVMTFRVEAKYPNNAQLDVLRSELPKAIFQPLYFKQGFLRLLPIGKGLKLPAELLSPQAINWNDLGRASYWLQLEGDSAILIEGLLAHQSLPLLAYAEIEYAVIVPGVPVSVAFNPAVLAEALCGDFPTTPLNLEQLRRRLAEELVELPLTWSATVGNSVGNSVLKHSAELVADALLARLRKYLMHFVPAPEADGQSFLALNDLSSGRITWDLSDPFEGRGNACLSLHPFDTLARIGDPNRYIERIALPKVGFGNWQVNIQADLPPGLDAQFAITLQAPANPPHRMAALTTELLTLNPPNYQRQVTLRFSPGEQPAFSATCYCRLTDGTWERAATSITRSANPLHLTLCTEDFPVRFATLALSDRLVALAGLRCTASWQVDGLRASRSITLDAAHSIATLCWPIAAGNCQLSIEAASLSSEKTFARVDLPLRSIELDTAHFPGFGQQSITVVCDFPSNYRNALIVELRSEDAQIAGVIRLTSVRNVDHFTWWSETPFPPRFQWRIRGDKTWIGQISAGETLSLAIDPRTGIAHQHLTKHTL